MKCPKCEGKGWYWDHAPFNYPGEKDRMISCNECKGTGEVPDEHDVVEEQI